MRNGNVTSKRTAGGFGGDGGDGGSHSCLWLKELQDFAAALSPLVRQDDAEVPTLLAVNASTSLVLLFLYSAPMV